MSTLCAGLILIGIILIGASIGLGVTSPCDPDHENRYSQAVDYVGRFLAVTGPLLVIVGAYTLMVIKLGASSP